MYSIVIWKNKTTNIPSVIGPYESDLVYDDASLLKKKFYKVLVCQNTSPDKAEILTLLSNTK